MDNEYKLTVTRNHEAKSKIFSKLPFDDVKLLQEYCVIVMNDDEKWVGVDIRLPLRQRKE